MLTSLLDVQDGQEHVNMKHARVCADGVTEHHHATLRK